MRNTIKNMSNGRRYLAYNNGIVEQVTQFQSGKTKSEISYYAPQDDGSAGADFIFEGKLPRDITGKFFKLKEVFTRSSISFGDQIPDAQCLYVDYGNGRTRRFSFSKRTGRSWEVLPDGINLPTDRATRPYFY
jgi:hypothetical protein